MTSIRSNNLLYPFQDNDISLFSKRINHRLNKDSLKKLEIQFQNSANSEEISNKTKHLEL